MEGVTHRQGQDPEPDPVASVLERAARGDEAAWREIIERFGKRVFALARSRCRNSDVADEITQSVFATVAAKLGQGLYTERGRFESWLFRVTMNRVRDEVRRARRQPVVPDSDALFDREPHRGPGPGDEAREASPELGALRAAIDELNDPDREVVELRHHAGLSFKQISDLLDEPVGTLLARHHRALRKLREIMEQGRRETGPREMKAARPA